MFAIKWKQDGKTFEKTYDSKAGLQYRRRQIVKKFGEDAIVSETQVSGSGDQRVEISVGPKESNEMLGPVDPELSRLDLGELQEAPRLIHSNWNYKTKSYTSRMYAKDFGRGVRVIEPDGSVSLEGERSKVVQSVAKGSYVQVLSDGRLFDAFGWPVREAGE